MANDPPAASKPKLFDRISAWLAREPENREELVELLRACYDRKASPPEDGSIGRGLDADAASHQHR